MEWVDICKRDKAWNLARKALLNGTCAVIDTRLINCLKYGNPMDLNEDPAEGCFKKLLEDYGE